MTQKIENNLISELLTRKNKNDKISELLTRIKQTNQNFRVSSSK